MCALCGSDMPSEEVRGRRAPGGSEWTIRFLVGTWRTATVLTDVETRRKKIQCAVSPVKML